MEGVTANIMLLQTLISEVKAGPSLLYLAFIDFKKAFNSISHPALLNAVKGARLSTDSVEYLAYVLGKYQLLCWVQRLKLLEG